MQKAKSHLYLHSYMKNIFASGYGKETQENKKSVDYEDENANIFFNTLFSAVCFCAPNTFFQK